MIKFLKYSFVVVLVSFTLLTLFYIYFPGRFMSRIAFSTRMVFDKMEMNKPYETKYGLHPYLNNKIEEVIKEAKSKGIDIRIVSGYRSNEKQNNLYMSGRNGKGHIVTNAPAGFSYHNYGLAVDVCEFVNGKPNWKSKHWDTIGKIGKEQGLIWGGEWKSIVDKPHFQLSVWDIITNVLL